MKIFVAGASGVLGRSLIPILIKDGHEVFGMTHHESNRSVINQLGAIPIVADALNLETVVTALQQTRPEVVIHQLTSLGSYNVADNAEMRNIGTRNLVQASQAVDVKKMIAQSISWAYEPGNEPADEHVSLDIHAPTPRKTTIDGVVSLEQSVSAMANHVILRYGTLYGPGTWYDKSGLNTVKILHGEVPATDGITSFVHVHDAARAASQALHWPTGPVNIVDDEPSAGTEWLPVFTSVIGAPKPTVQEGSNRGERGACNRLARKDFRWQPMFPTWRNGFKQI
ncbi:dTDP-glucose 4,6-dehydratase [Paenibacillus macquariensis subsp. defensor]|nr:dTDP-glucose 4,6-dehydratase [Paenibacillus macquariensis subsp. defensor]